MPAPAQPHAWSVHATVESTGDVTVVRIDGRLGSAGAAELEQALRAAPVAPGAWHLDLSGVDYISSAGIATLRAFVSCASEVLALEHEADLTERSLGEKAQANLRAQAAIEGYFANMIELAGERAVRSAMPALVGPYANQLIEQMEAISKAAAASQGTADRRRRSIADRAGRGDMVRTAAACAGAWSGPSSAEPPAAGRRVSSRGQRRGRSARARRPPPPPRRHPGREPAAGRRGRLRR